MKRVFGILFIISLLASIILLFVSICNYMIAYLATGQELLEAITNNVYVRYWVNLLAFSASTFLISLIGFLVIRPKVVEQDGFRMYENQRNQGVGPVDEYVTVRVKKNDLSKLKE